MPMFLCSSTVRDMCVCVSVAQDYNRGVAKDTAEAEQWRSASGPAAGGPAAKVDKVPKTLVLAHVRKFVTPVKGAKQWREKKSNSIRVTHVIDGTEVHTSAPVVGGNPDSALRWTAYWLWQVHRQVTGAECPWNEFSEFV